MGSSISKPGARKWTLLIASLAVVSLILFRGMRHNFRMSPRPPVSPKVRAVLDSAMKQTRTTTSYDPSYVRISYPGGDVPANTGVCADVVVRSLRAAGVDLQVKVHEDMKRHFAVYPHKWGLRKPDTNIDHRRVPNLMTFFKRKHKDVPVTRNADDYHPGDIVVWDLGRGLLHTGLVSDRPGRNGEPQVIHNIGAGAQLEDRLFDWRIIGHYRYFR